MKRPVTTRTVAARRSAPAESTLSPTPVPTGLGPRRSRRVGARKLLGVIALQNIREVVVLLARSEIASGGALAASRDDHIGDARVALLAG